MLGGEVFLIHDMKYHLCSNIFEVEISTIIAFGAIVAQKKFPKISSMSEVISLLLLHLTALQPIQVDRAEEIDISTLGANVVIF